MSDTIMNSSSSLKAFSVNIAKTELTLPLMNGLLLGAMHWLGAVTLQAWLPNLIFFITLIIFVLLPRTIILKLHGFPAHQSWHLLDMMRKKHLSMIPFWTNFMREKKEFIIKKRRADYSQMRSKQKDDIPRLLSNFWLPTLIHLRKEYFHVDLE